MEPKRKFNYKGGNIDELAKPKMVRKESKGSIRKESIDKAGKINNKYSAKLNKKILPNNITINNNKTNVKNSNYKVSASQYSTKKKNYGNNSKNKTKISIRSNTGNSGNNSYYNNSNSKQKSKNSFFDDNKKNINNVNINNISPAKKNRFNNIDEAVTLIQRCFREYLDKIHNTNSELMKMIQERKKYFTKL